MATLEDQQVLVQLRSGVVGPFSVSKLRQLKGFTLQTLVSFPGSEKWAPAFRVLNLKSYFEGRFDITAGGADIVPPDTAQPDFVFTPSPPVTLAKSWVGSGRPARAPFVDRWFRGLVLFNLLIAVAAYAAWSTLSTRVVIQREWSITLACVKVSPPLQNLFEKAKTSIAKTVKNIPLRREMMLVRTHLPAALQAPTVVVQNGPSKAAAPMVLAQKTRAKPAGPTVILQNPAPKATAPVAIVRKPALKSRVPVIVVRKLKSVAPTVFLRKSGSKQARVSSTHFVKPVRPS